MTKKELTIISACAGVMVLALTVPVIVISVDMSHRDTVISIPAHYDSNYKEDYEDYKFAEGLEDMNWDEFITNPDLILTFNASVADAKITTVSSKPNTSNMTEDDAYLATLNENDAWTLVTDGLINSYPKQSFKFYQSALTSLKADQTETITVDIWYWANPDDDTDFTKISTTKTFAVNSHIANMFIHIFQDIYNDPSQPVINIADRGMGTWVLRGKNNNSGGGGVSAHAIGCGIDLNPSTGSFKIDGRWYGNGYNHGVLTTEQWEQLPENHTKYHMIYSGSPISEIFKAYGFSWGGDWSGAKDPMHFSYIGDGDNARQIGAMNYYKRRK